MGQKVGKANFVDSAKTFVNLPKESIGALWQEFNLFATGWGVSPEFFDRLCQAVAKSMGTESDPKANSDLFSALDTDENNLVDGLELISTLGMVSGMTREEKVEFVFACYDVGGRSRLSMNELFLLLKSTSAGLCKLSGMHMPDSARLESIASLVFMHNKAGVEGGLSLHTLSSYCDTNPVASSWLAFYDDCESQRNDAADAADGSDSSAAELETAAPDIHGEEAFFAPRSRAQEDANAGAVDERVRAGQSLVPTGAWVQAAKELVPPSPPPEEGEEADPDVDEDAATASAAAAAAAKENAVPPPPPPASPAPDTQLSLEWVYGYSAASSRASACYFSTTGTGGAATATAAGNGGGAGAWAPGGGGGVGVVYPAGKVAVVLSQPLDDEGGEVEGVRVQSFMQEHTDEITALAVSPCGKWVATGEVGAHPKIDPIFLMPQLMDRTYDERTGASRPLGMAWTVDGSSLVTCGQTHKDSPPLIFWVKVAATGSFAKKRGIARGGNLAPSSDVQLVVCAAPAVRGGGASSSPSSSPPCMISGTIGGGLCMWTGRNCSKAVKGAHTGAVEVLSFGVIGRGGVVASGGRDAKVKLWSSVDLSPLATLDVMATPSVTGLRQVRSVCLSADGTKALVGTLGSDILELATVEKPKGEDGEEEEEAPADVEEGGAALRAKTSGVGRILNGGLPLACGHCKGEAKGLAGELKSLDVSAQGDQFVTVGDDGTIRVWSNVDKRVIRTFNIGSPALSVSYSPDASLIAVGLASGGVSVMKTSEEDVTTLQLEKHLKGFKGAAGAGIGATCVRFSPSGAALSAGGSDGGVKAWATAEGDWEATGSADKAVSGAVIGMDFTSDGRFLMLNSSGMDMIIVNADTCKRASPKDMKSLRGEGEGAEVANWASSTCTMTNGKQAAWVTMLSAAVDEPGSGGIGGMASASSPSPPYAQATGAATLTSSDLLRGGEAPVLLASDSFGRVGLLRYPAQLPPEPAFPPPRTAAAAASGDVGAASAGVPRVRTPEEAEAAGTLAEAVEAAVPRASMVKAHAGKVAAARQIGDGAGVITVGATDRCVYQWAVAHLEGEESGDDLPDPPACNAPPPKAAKRGGEGEEEEEAEGEDGEEGETPAAADWSGEDEDLVENAAKTKSTFNSGSQDMSAFLTERTRAENGSPTSVLPPWLSGDAALHSTPCVPDEDLQLEWIHGYSAQGSRQNLFYNRNGEIVYPAACAGVVMTKCTKPKRHRQAYNLDHTQAISCLAMHPDKALVATGQEGSSPLVLVWNSTSKPPKTAARLQLDADKKGVSQVSFSADGSLLAVACEDKSHTVMVFRWEAGLLRCQARLGVKKALSLCFSLDACELLAAGHKHFKVWTLSGGGLMQGKRGLFGSGSKVQALTCAAAVSNGEAGGSSFVLGGSSGNLLKLEGGRKISSEVEAHEGPVYALYAYAAPDGSGTCLVTGGADGKIKTWDTELGMANEFDIIGRPYLWSSGGAPRVRSVCLNDHSDGRKILVGTSCSEIIEISASDGSDVNGGDCLMRGHCRDQLWGLASHPAKAVYATAGDDFMLKEWDAVTLALKREIDLAGWIRSARYTPNGLLIACGMGGETTGEGAGVQAGGAKRHSPREEDGTIKIVSGMEDAFRVVNTLSDAVGPISCIRFSPDGNRMAAASLDGSVYIYSVLENFKLECIGEGGHGGVLRIDFSSDGKWIRAEARTKAAEGDSASPVATFLLSASSGEISQDMAVVDPVNGFATWSGLFSDHVSGVWPVDTMSALDVTACCRSLEKNLLATSDARGDIKLFRYPATGVSASCKTFKVHAPGARSVCFLDKGVRSQHVISIGGKDRCVAQWKVIQPDGSASTTMEEASKAGNAEKDPLVQAELSALLTTRRLGSASASPLSRPWMSGAGLTGVAPASDPSAPAEIASIGLEFAHGYNSSGLNRNNLGFSDADKVILPCASVGVVYDKATHSQVLFTGHRGRVVSLAVSRCGRFVATGQEGKDASAIVWDPATGHQTCVLPTSLSGAVRRLSFSPDGSMLCGVGADRDNSLCVWASARGDWADGARMALGQGPRRAAMFVAWSAGGRCDDPCPYQVITGGQNYVVFWTLWPNLSCRLGKASSCSPIADAAAAAAAAAATATDPAGAGQQPERAPASNEAVSAPPPPPANAAAAAASVFTSAEKVMAETFTCGVAVGHGAIRPSVDAPPAGMAGPAAAATPAPVTVTVAVTGTASGAFAVWENFECVKMLQAAHGTTGVLCLSSTFSGGFVSGGADGVVRIWDENINLSGAPIRISQEGAACEAVRAVAVNRKESSLAVGTSFGRVIEVSLDSGDSSVLVDGPAPAFPAAVTANNNNYNRAALTASPTDADVFLTAADDGYLRKWSVGGRRLTEKLAVGEIPPAALTGAIAPPPSPPGIGAIDWAPKGSFVACGLATGDVVLVAPDRGMALLSRCPSDKKPKSPVSAVAVSLNESTLVAGCADGSLHGMKVSQGGAGVAHAWSKSAAAGAASVVAIDMSTNGQIFRYCDASGALSYVTSTGAAMSADPSENEASTWASSKCFVGHWGVRAASGAGSGVEASASCRSNGKDLLAACSDDGPIGLWRYPASQEGAACVKGEDAIVSAPAALTFTANDSRIIAVGGEDYSVLQWSIVRSKQ